MKEFITIGKISKNCKSLIIYCGDYSSDDTTECTYNIINNKISAFDDDFLYESEEEIFKPNSKALNELSNNIKSFGIELSANSIYNAYNLLIHKKDSFAQRWIIVDSEGGAFQNEELKYNGMCYFRRILEKNEHIIEESICIKLI
tara:strand:+ start:190 stop:624 length:435 start_codon:yes stop_codon:yes gene_type:complete